MNKYDVIYSLVICGRRDMQIWNMEKQEKTLKYKLKLEESMWTLDFFKKKVCVYLTCLCIFIFIVLFIYAYLYAYVCVDFLALSERVKKQRPPLPPQKE